VGPCGAGGGVGVRGGAGLALRGLRGVRARSLL
jgi:hypothetical protein